MTTIANEQTENENSLQTIVIVTSNNLDMLKTQNVHTSSSAMRTEQNEHISTNTQSMKPYPSLNTIVNEQSTISTSVQTTMSNQQTTFVTNSHPSTNVVTTENELKSTMKRSSDYIQSPLNNLMTSKDKYNSTLSKSVLFISSFSEDSKHLSIFCI